MRIYDLTDLFARGRRRCVQVGDAEAGVLVGLDLEGRLFAYRDAEVLHRVNPEAILSESTAEQYHNPGGDGFWPAPEGSRVGYFYATGAWRVPPGLSGCRYRVIESEADRAVIRAEIDLINTRGIGLPLAFERRIAVACDGASLSMTVADSIEYVGSRPLDAAQARIAPWTLAQFGTSPGMEVVFPAVPEESVVDFYDPSDELRRSDGEMWHVKTEGGRRFQVGLAPDVDWIELRIPEKNLCVRRTNRVLNEDQDYVDIADRPPDRPPADFRCRYSIYNDGGNFMEIEASGTCPRELAAGAAMGHEVTTTFAPLGP